MAMAANGVFQEWQDRGGKASEWASPALKSPQDAVAELFLELGLDRFLAPAPDASEIRVQDVLRFVAAENIPDMATPVADPEPVNSAVGPVAPERIGAAPRPEIRVDAEMPPAEASTAAEPADASSLNMGEVPAVEGTKPGEPAGPEAPSHEDNGLPLLAAPSIGDESRPWLGIDMTEPREWTADDLMMLMYRDRAATGHSRAPGPAAGGTITARSLEDYIDPVAFEGFPFEDLIAAA
jgi:hypothetical protein